MCERVPRSQLLLNICGDYTLKMHKITVFILAAVFAVALAEGQYYVPRAYYTIDAEGHESAHVPLRRLRRSIQPYPNPSGFEANANANANARASGGGSATANANAEASGWGGQGGGWGGEGGRGGRYDGGSGAWGQPGHGYGATNPALSAGMTRRQYGAVQGKSVSASTSVGLGASGVGYYDQYASVH